LDITYDNHKSSYFQIRIHYIIRRESTLRTNKKNYKIEKKKKKVKIDITARKDISDIIR